VLAEAATLATASDEQSSSHVPGSGQEQQTARIAGVPGRALLVVTSNIELTSEDAVLSDADVA
jgi:hypothetical protein